MSLQGKLAGTVDSRLSQVGRPADVALATAGDGFADNKEVADTFLRGTKASGANRAKVVFGPAARSLPQSPIAVDAEGHLIAKGDFSVPVGPGYWERGDAEAEVRQQGGTA
ncbi:hypothetical protein ACIBF6_43760 [Streptosporangium amethystogenes]|uniref:hypothetical protein n=1 Tax=Streptosporangium amethystogenes TaxID=2002 RepID=UPI0037A0178A